MPELPEVETVRLGLADALLGRTLTRVSINRADLRKPFPPDFAGRLANRQVKGVRRRAKYLLLDLNGGETLIMHMGMSGRFTVYGHNAPRDDGKHDHVIFETDDFKRVVFTDPRRFGLMSLAATGEVDSHPLFAGIGPEPLDKTFTAAQLSAGLKGKRTPIKAALLDQRVVAGLGNIYVCEALFRAGISPRRLASSVAGARAERLVPAIKSVLQEALAAGGSSLRDYAHADGELGYFQHHFRVYDRDGKPCPKCGTKIKRIVQSGRSTFFCPHCQR
ncbi:MAG TPA: bifunctional DNA-formamidopyrimidine glycosylase/DNA-(apurinic or apyrimidinic site) lyase [Micropepsaceae bacterium]|nr:bifunctional DNA-formamidopyrimidine glycosylase/DNA-(apurinic or apyrimidinic site) lyase [Micropepsaceae bacterium]